MTANVKLAERLEALRFDPRHHIGAGDIRLTLAQQDEIIAALRSPSPAHGMYSVEDIRGWLFHLLQDEVGVADLIESLNNEDESIVAWKAKQPPSTNDAQLAWADTLPNPDWYIGKQSNTPLSGTSPLEGKVGKEKV